MLILMYMLGCLNDYTEASVQVCKEKQKHSRSVSALTFLTEKKGGVRGKRV